MPVFARPWPVHGAGKPVVWVQEDEELGAFESRPDGLQGGIVEPLGEARRAEDDAANMGQRIQAPDLGYDVRRRCGEGEGRECVEAVCAT